MAQRLKRLPPMQEMWVWSLGQEDPLEKEMVTHSNILAWRIPWMEKPGRLQSMGSQRVGLDWATSLTHHAVITDFQTSAPSFIPTCFTQSVKAFRLQLPTYKWFMQLSFFFFFSEFINSSKTRVVFSLFLYPLEHWHNPKVHTRISLSMYLLINWLLFLYEI